MSQLFDGLFIGLVFIAIIFPSCCVNKAILNYNSAFLDFLFYIDCFKNMFYYTGIVNEFHHSALAPDAHSLTVLCSSRKVTLCPPCPTVDPSDLSMSASMCFFHAAS